MKETKMLKRILLSALCLSLCACGNSGSDDTNNDNTQSGQTQETNMTQAGKDAIAIDLGLSVKWADRNVGANGVEYYGDYFGWGDPTGLNQSTDDNEYPSSNPPQSICGTKYDAAHVKWGGNWRMPTFVEVSELLENCTFVDTNVPVSGINVISKKNGNKIFLPKGGWRNGQKREKVGQYGYFWTGDRYANDKSAASLEIDVPGHVYTSGIYGRFPGYNIRPVLP